MMKSFLLALKQRVILNDHNSSWATVKLGVPYLINDCSLHCSANISNNVLSKMGDKAFNRYKMRFNNIQ